MRRISAAVAAVVIPTSMLLAASSAPAWAKAAKAEKSITCKSFSGTLSGTITIGGCNGNTGGSSAALTVSTLASGGMINWTNGKSTTIGQPTLGSIKSSKCKATGDIAESVSAAVTADTTGLTSLGTLTTQVCIAGTSISALKPVKIT